MVCHPHRDGAANDLQLNGVKRMNVRPPCDCNASQFAIDTAPLAVTGHSHLM
jgi:hypothetical protein